MPATTHLFRLLGENHAGYGDLMHDFAWHAVCTDVADLLDCKLGRWSTEWTAQRLMHEVPERTIGGLLRYLHVQEAAAQGKTQVFIKEIETFRYWDHLRESFPAARFVYLVRDPRDMALSWKKSAAIRGGVVRAAQAWHRDQRGFASIVAELQASRRVLQRTKGCSATPRKPWPPSCDFWIANMNPNSSSSIAARMRRNWRIPPGTSPTLGVR